MKWKWIETGVDKFQVLNPNHISSSSHESHRRTDLSLPKRNDQVGCIGSSDLVILTLAFLGFEKHFFNLCDKKKQFSTFNGQITRKLCWAYLVLKNIQNVACGKCHLPQWQQWLKVLKTKERKKAPKKRNTEAIIKEDNADPLFNSNTAPNVIRCVERNGDTCSCETHCFTITMCVIKSTNPKSISISLILWLLEVGDFVMPKSV